MKKVSNNTPSAQLLKLPFSVRMQRKNPCTSRICFASQRNIFIDANGDIHPCCFNRAKPWGNMNTDTLAEIENSMVRTELEERLQQNRWGNDCSFCNDSLSAGNFKATGALTYDKFFFQRGSYPYSMEFEIDTFCNLNCVMCPETLHSGKPQTGLNNLLAEKITPWLQKIRWAKFYGGEPFLISGYYDIWNILAEKNPDCLIKVQTNGTVLNDNVKKALERGRFQISVSIDSLHPEKYAVIRRGSELTRVLDNLTYFQHYAKRTGIPLDIAVCPMAQNAEDIPELFRHCCNNRMYINFNVLTQPREMSLRYQSSAFLHNLIETYGAIRSSSFSFISWQNRRHLASLIHQIKTWHNESLELEKIPRVCISKTELARMIAEKSHPEKKNEMLRALTDALAEEEEQIHVREDIYKKMQNLDEAVLLQVFSDTSAKELRHVIRNFLRYGSR